MKNLPPNYSPFCAIVAVFLAFSVLQTVNLKNMLEQQKRQKETLAQTQKVAAQAVTINNTVESLGKDLLAMPNKEAQQIVADFKIAPNAQR
jgi:hypothetical protein